jgi:tRNA nucleotidyltransferase/poly(A) polymerase
MDESDGFATDSDRQDKVSDEPRDREWKQLNSKDLGLSSSMIAKSTRKVLNGLKSKGHDVYLVGGCVRDLILKRTPKDFDILTSAELREVVRTFPRCEIVGRRFPICHVHIGDDLIEVFFFF